MLPLLTLLESVEFEARRRGIPREWLLRSAGLSEVEFNAVVGGRLRLTDEQERRVGELIPLPVWELLMPGPSRLSRSRDGRVAREERR